MPQLFDSDRISSQILERWGVIDWDRFFPWWRRPAKVRILMYADGPVAFNGGGFLGLQYVYRLLTSRAYSYVDFDVEFAHRTGSDPSATIAGPHTLLDLDIMNDFDQIWFFGFNSTTVGPAGLSAQELALLEQFMDAPKYGGVLVTGDHADLGRSLAGEIPRAGEMRRYPAPGNTKPGWNTTLEEGPDPGSIYDFEDQSDDRPQTIRWKRYPLWGLFAVFGRRFRPHPVLCSQEGPIDVFPDHQHEGEALAPVPSPGDQVWPTVAGHQQHPEVIAWGRIKDPAATSAGKEIGVVSAYDGHNVNVGRIIADSTWHHWFDINLTGIAAVGPYAGFDATASGQLALKKIDAYFLNVGVWLSSPDRLAVMRLAAWWATVWDNQVIELSVDSPVWFIGEQAIDVLGRRAAPCTITDWVLDLPVFKAKIQRWEWPMILEEFQLTEIPLEQYLAGGMLRRLMIDFGPGKGDCEFPTEPPSDDELQRAMSIGAMEGLDELSERLRDEGQRVIRLAETMST